MAYETEQSSSTTIKTLYDKDVDGLGPYEWEIETDVAADFYITGVLPAASDGRSKMTLAADGSRTIGTLAQGGIIKIEVQNAATTGTAKLFPRVS